MFFKLGKTDEKVKDSSDEVTAKSPPVYESDHDFLQRNGKKFSSDK